METKTIDMVQQVSLDECKIITQWIQKENKTNVPHMIEVTSEELLETANTYGCCAIKHNDELIGFIKVLPVEKEGILLLERGSVIIKEEYRNQGRAKHLIKMILDNHKETPMYSVTNVRAIEKISQSFGQYKYTANDIPKQILEIIEMPGKLLENDTVYTNEILHVLIQKLG